VISAESTISHFGSRLNEGDQVVQAWGLAARFSLLPFGITRFRVLDGALDGSFEVGLEPTFERLETEGQNFGGLGLALRYYLLHFRYGNWVPWVDASIAPGGSDFRIGRVSDKTRLTGPFMDLIQAGVGVSYFMNQHWAPYFGLQAQHISNGGFNGGSRNYDLNTAASVVVGVSWFGLIGR